MSLATAEAPRKAVRIKRELDTREFKPNQRAALKMPAITEEIVRDSNIVLAEGPLPKNQLDELAFNEQPIKILIHKGGEKSQGRATDYIAINSIPGEILFKNGWVPMGYFPRGISFYTKRKYVTVLARAKKDSIETNVIQRDNEDPENFVERSTTSALSFSVLEDKDPRGAEWIELLVRANS